MDPQDFLRLAQHAGACFLYRETDCFDAEAFPAVAMSDEELGLLEKPNRRRVKDLQRTARSHDGELAGVDLCFVREGVAHYWVSEAPWSSALDAAWAEFKEQRRLDEEARESNKAARLQEEAERLAAQLTDLPAFRSETRYAAWEEIAHTLVPEPDTDEEEARAAHGFVIRSAIRDASQVVERESRRVYASYRSDLDALAREISDHGLLAGASTKEVRRIRIQDFLIGKSGGYGPPKTLVDLLLDRPELDPKRRRAMAGADGLFALN
ncbi:hypothetical protein ACWCPS_38480 [Streptomyces mauvecolor]